MYNHFKAKLEAEVKYYGEDIVAKLKEEIIAESHRLSDECLDKTIANKNAWIQQVKVKPAKIFNQTCYMLTQQELMVSHLQIEQIIRWKRQFPTWRMKQTAQAPGNDVPNFCYNPVYAKGYQLSLGKTERKRKWGFWDFVQIKTNQYDVKNQLSDEIQELLKTYPKPLFRENNFIYNDPSKPSAEYIELDPSLI